MHLTVRTSDLSLFMTLSNDYIINARYYVQLSICASYKFFLDACNQPVECPKKQLSPACTVHCVHCAIPIPNALCMSTSLSLSTRRQNFRLLLHPFSVRGHANNVKTNPLPCSKGENTVSKCARMASPSPLP